VNAALVQSDVNAPSFRWTYVEGTNEGSGLISQQVASNGKQIQLAHFNKEHEGVQQDRWITVRTSSFDRHLFSAVLIYEKTPLTYTLSLSDQVGEVSLNGTDTGSMIVKTWATGQIEYIPVTVSMLSQGSSAAGTYKNVTVTYNGNVVTNDYTLVVNGGNTIQLEESEYGYYYRLTDEFVLNHDYLILDRNDKGYGILMQSTGDEAPVGTADVLVTLDANGIPSVQTSQISNATLQSWRYRQKDGYYCLYQPNAFSSAYSNYLRVTDNISGVLMTGNTKLTTQDNPSFKQTTFTAPEIATANNITTIKGKGGKTNVIDMFIMFNSNNFWAYRDYDLINADGREVYIYEKVTYNTAVVTPLGTKGHVAAGDAVSTQTGSGILITYPDGQVKTEKVTAHMLYKNGNPLTAADIENKTTLTGLTLKYRGATVTTDYTLVVRAADDEPAYPDPGSVKVGKDLFKTDVNFDETGVARIDLSTTGIPRGKVDVLVIVDTSGSVGLYRTDDGRVRIAVFEGRSLCQREVYKCPESKEMVLLIRHEEGRHTMPFGMAKPAGRPKNPTK
jgi:hypothetical protein